MTELTLDVSRGACACGRCTVRLALPSPLGEHTPRACDCDFCTARGVAYLSARDAQITLDSTGGWHRERQGSGQAEFLSCAHCGELLAVVAPFDDGWRGAVNARRLDDQHLLAEAQAVSPKLLDASTKRSRWGTLWGRAEVTETTPAAGAS
ncbi:MAG: aldehyde-activating protein [Pseudomonadota bacterium]